MNPFYLTRDKQYLVRSLSPGTAVANAAERFPNFNNFEMIINIYRMPIPRGKYLNGIRTCNLPLITSRPEVVSLAIMSDLTTSQDLIPIEQMLGRSWDKDVIYIQELILNPKLVRTDVATFKDERYVINNYSPYFQLYFGEPGDTSTVGDLHWELWFGDSPVTNPTQIQEMNIRLHNDNAVKYVPATVDPVAAAKPHYLLSVPFFAPTSYNVSINSVYTAGNTVVLQSRFVSGLTQGGEQLTSLYEFTNSIESGAGGGVDTKSAILTGSVNYGTNDAGAILHIRCIPPASPLPDAGTVLANISITAQKFEECSFFATSRSFGDYPGGV